MLLFITLLGVRAATAEDASEAQVKAAFVYNFARFAEWPHDAFASPGAPIIIGVVDDASFAHMLEQTVNGKRINGRCIHIKQIASETDLKGRMHVVYFPALPGKRTSSFLAALAGTSVLTVGDSDRFIRSGGMIRFYVQDAHMRFEINLDSAERAHLKLSSRLLALARIVRGAGTER
jgi:hypothetical protein